MKNILLAAAHLVVSYPLQSQPRNAVNITNATMFLNGAELMSSAKISLPAGESEVLFTNIAGNVNQQSLTIGAENEVVVQSASFQNNFLGDSAISPRVKFLRDSIDYYDTQRLLLEDRKTVIEDQMSVLKENRKIAGDYVSLSVAELQKMLDVVGTKTTALLAASREIASKSTLIQRRLEWLRAQIDEEQKRSFQPGGSLLVKFYAPSATATNIKMSYVVPNAGWTPAYDLRVDKVNDPVKLFYKANVYQNCGVKWTNVKLSLSTGNPNEGIEAPKLSPQYLAYYNPFTTNEISINKSGGVNMLNNIASLSQQVYQQKNSGLNIGGGRTSGAKYIIDGVQVGSQPTTLNNYTAVDASGINTVFDIDLPYSIPSDGQMHTVAIKTYELPALYRHYAVPHLDKDAFLQAQITKWEDLNLLPAATSVFFEGNYVGQGFIDMRNVRDTMNLSLGRDKKIIISRERDKNFHSTKIIGANARQEYAYTISIRNTRKESVNLVVLDQIPVSNENDIVLEDPQIGAANYEPTTGLVKWQLDVNASEQKKLKWGFIIKYPKGKILSGIN